MAGMNPADPAIPQTIKGLRARTPDHREQSEDCRCPRSGDLWRCEARPDLVRTPDGRRCELGVFMAAHNGSDWWPDGCATCPSRTTEEVRV